MTSELSSGGSGQAGRGSESSSLAWSDSESTVTGQGRQGGAYRLTGDPPRFRLENRLVPVRGQQVPVSTG